MADQNKKGKALQDPLEGLACGTPEWLKAAKLLGIQVRINNQPANWDEPDNQFRPWKHKHLSNDELYDKYSRVDVPAYMKKLRQGLLGVTMEGLGEVMGISKGHIAKLEGGTAVATTTIQLVFWDIIERVLRNKGMEWNDLGEENVDQMVPDAYKKRRNWQPDRNIVWPYAKEKNLIVVGYIPPTLQNRLPEMMGDKLHEAIEKRPLKKGQSFVPAGQTEPAAWSFLGKEPHQSMETKKKEVAKQKGTILAGGLLGPLEGKVNKDGAAEAIFQDPPFKSPSASRAFLLKAKKEAKVIEELTAKATEKHNELEKNHAVLMMQVASMTTQLQMKDDIIKSKDEVIEALREHIQEMKVVSLAVPKANLIDQPIEKSDSENEKE